DLIREIDRTVKKDRLFRLEKLGRGLSRRVEKPGGAPLFLNVALGGLMLALGIFYFLGYNASTPEQAKEEIARGLGLTSSTTPEAPAKAKPVEAEPKPTETDPPAVKPPIDLSLEDSLPDQPTATANIPRPRSTADLSLIDDAPALPPPPIQPQAAGQPQLEPQPELRPEGTDPVKAQSPPRAVEPTAPSNNGTPPPPRPRPGLRAVPVAATD
ncbi:MAG TPA: hypothetical protein PLA50_09325, partial [Bacteroidia bacterium]|nr:hypothetical protein [Bacteroidia bacterium]